MKFILNKETGHKILILPMSYMIYSASTFLHVHVLCAVCYITFIHLQCSYFGSCERCWLVAGWFLLSVQIPLENILKNLKIFWMKTGYGLFGKFCNIRRVKERPTPMKMEQKLGWLIPSCCSW
jgi:hypothetical protein